MSRKEFKEGVTQSIFPFSSTAIALLGAEISAGLQDPNGIIQHIPEYFEITNHELFQELRNVVNGLSNPNRAGAVWMGGITCYASAVITAREKGLDIPVVTRADMVEAGKDVKNFIPDSPPKIPISMDARSHTAESFASDFTRTEVQLVGMFRNMFSIIPLDGQTIEKTEIEFGQACLITGATFVYYPLQAAHQRLSKAPHRKTK